MRVTNHMTHNKSLNNINRNMRHLQRLYEQTTSGKVINRPSQNPLVASRSLRFRAQLMTNEQHQRNVESGHAWMNVSEATFFNLLRGDAEGSLFGSIKDELLRAANDTGTLEDKLVMLSHIENLMRQVGLEMNQTYAGRFVFAGWSTEQPPVLMRPLMNEDNTTPATHVITQTFNIRDIEQTYSFQRFPAGDLNHPRGDITGGPVVERVNIIKLPFREQNGTQLMFGSTLVSADPMVTDPADWPFSWGGHWLGDTSIPAGTVPVGAADVQYPMAPLDVTTPVPPPLGIFRPEGSTQPPFEIIRMNANNPDAFTPPNDPVNGNFIIHYIPETGELVMGSQARDSFEDGTTVTYQVHALQTGDLNPFVYFDTVSSVPRTIEPRSYEWTLDPRQAIYYEFHVGAPVQVNVLAKEIFTSRMFADLTRLIDFARSLVPPDRRELEQVFSAAPPYGLGLSGDDLDTRIDKHMVEENNHIRSILFDRINNMLRFMDEHTIHAAREHTNLGTRMRRVEMFELRLEQDEGNVTMLMSENEDVDLTEAMLGQAAAEAAYAAALRVIANNIQLSLVNFV